VKTVMSLHGFLLSL